MVSLEGRDCLPGHRTENSVNRPRVIPVALQLRLHVHDHLIGGKVIVAVNGAIVGIVSSRTVTPGRIPVTRVPVIPAATYEDNPIVRASPPTAIVPCSVIITKRGVRLTAEAGASPVVGNPRISSAIDRGVPLTIDRQISFTSDRSVSLTIDRHVSLAIETSCAIYADVSRAIGRNLAAGLD